MARITAGVDDVATCPRSARRSTIGKTAEPYWQPVFDGYEFSKQLDRRSTCPTSSILVYNDHASAFALDIIPTFAHRLRGRVPAGRRRLGPAARARRCRAIRSSPGTSRSRVILDEFDMTIVNQMDVDHGLTVPLSLMFGQPRGVAVQGHPARGQRRPRIRRRRAIAAAQLGQAIRRAVETFDEDLNVQIWGTGGMSHQLQGPRAGLINKEFDHALPRPT